MADYASDEEQLEAIKEWWQDNGKSILAGLVVGVLVLAGWRGWHWYRNNQAQHASDVYQRVTDTMEAGDRSGLVEAAKRLRSDFPRTAYAPLAALAAAQSAVEDDDLEAATGWLRWAMNNADETHVAMIARGRLARVLAARDQADAALKLLKTDHPETYDGLLAEIRGDILSGQDQSDAAANAYQRALDAEPPAPDAKVVQRKLGRAQSADGQANAQADGKDTSKGDSSQGDPDDSEAN